MAFAKHADFVIVGAGTHGVSNAWKLAEHLKAAGDEVQRRIVIPEKSRAMHVCDLESGGSDFGRFATGDLRPMSNSSNSWS